MRKAVVAASLLAVAVACTKGVGTGPTPIEQPPAQQSSTAPVESASVGGPKLKQATTAWVEGTTVVGEIRTLYNEDLGPVAMLVFNFAHNRYIDGTVEYVSGPVGKVTTFRVNIGRAECGTKLQVDFIRAPNGITEQMRNNQLFHGDFIDAEFPETEACPGPKPSPSPSPSPSPCPEYQTSGEYEEDDPCAPPPCDEEESWVEEEQNDVIYGEWGECQPTEGEVDILTNNPPPPSCFRSRSAVTVVYEVNTCTQERREKGRREGSQSEPCECPPPPAPDYCFYNISGNPIFKFSFCLSTGGAWGNWNGQGNHCRYSFPGISSTFAQLTGGQSGTGCLSKQDD